MIRRAVVLVALAAALVPTPPAAAEAEPPVAAVGAPIPVDGAPASLFRPSTLRATFRVPRADTALYIGTPWYVRDLTITLVGPGARRETLTAVPDLPGHMLGLRLPDNAASADRIELQATAVSTATPPYLLPAERLATIGWRSWWYQTLFGLFGAFALLSGVLAIALRSRANGGTVLRWGAFAWFAVFAAANAALMIPWLGIVRPPPEISQPLHALLQSLAYAALALFTLTLFREVPLPRFASHALRALVVLNVLAVAGGDALQDFWPFPDLFSQALVFALDAAFVSFGVIALRLNALGARTYLAATALATLGFLAAFVPVLDASFAQAAPLLGIALETLLLAVALVVPLVRSAPEAGLASAFASPSVPAVLHATPSGTHSAAAAVGTLRTVVLGPPPANADGLTGIPNRLALEEALARAWNRARRAGQPLAALLLDVDHFKKYNDEYGHLAGDDALRRIAEAVAQATARRQEDVGGRYGGEEFLMLLPETGLAGATRIAETLRSAVAALEIAHGGVASRRLTVSIGVAAFVPQHDGDGGELIRRATNALYLAKTIGRDRVVADEPAASQAALN
ncbi:MAG TPA: diguanylate cyclase [Candidatus Elarobacter sp.]|nr:diguanylate cyclase [Candidatus Elarobacter sp.]